LKRAIAKIVVFSAILVVYVAFVAWSISFHNNYIAAKIAQSEGLGLDRKYIDFPAFVSFWYGAACLYLGIIVVMIEIGILASFFKKKAKPAAVATALLCFCLLIGAFTPMVKSVTSGQVQNDPERAIH